MATDSTPVSPPALIIGGMHRSGTSLVASLCASAGLSIGRELLGGHASNLAGHFEDLDFYRFHESVLADNGRIPAGYDPLDTPPHVSASRRSEARALVDTRRGAGQAWGWKDPRTVLFLDFWLETVPEAKFLFVFRHPLLVADSLFRRGEATFRDDDERALRLWHRYNAALREFARTHHDRVLVRSIDHFIAAPSAIFADLRERLGLPLGDPTPLYRPEMLLTEDHPSIRGSPSPAIVAACEKLQAELQDLAATTVPDTAPSGPRRRAAVVVPVHRLPLTPDEEISFQQMRHHLFANDSIIVAPESLNVDCFGMRVVRFADEHFTSVASYNRLLLTADFYAAFRDYDYVLIYQLDCLVFSSDLESWCDREWDYAGAPWFANFGAGPDGGLWRAGNGGLSLRRIESHLRVLDRPDVQTFLERYEGQEDVFWSFEANRFEPGFVIPSADEAVAFSIESSPRHCFAINKNALPFGCHYWTRVDRGFWEHFLARGVRPAEPPAQAVLDDPRHPDHEWARAYATRLLQAIANEPDENRLTDLLTHDLPRAILDSTPTRERVEQAFQRVVSQPVPTAWFEFWVGKPHLTLRQLYRDLIRGPGFRERQARIAGQQNRKDGREP